MIYVYQEYVYDMKMLNKEEGCQVDKGMIVSRRAVFKLWKNCISLCQHFGITNDTIEGNMNFETI
jgi:hypothetical protein